MKDKGRKLKYLPFAYVCGNPEKGVVSRVLEIEGSRG
jgi:hypothetical protein